jgi:hypothetical protein
MQCSVEFDRGPTAKDATKSNHFHHSAEIFVMERLFTW